MERGLKAAGGGVCEQKGVNKQETDTLKIFFFGSPLLHSRGHTEPWRSSLRLYS